MEETEKERWKWIIGFNYFNAMDAALTLFILQNMGGRELNPFMAALINFHPLAFVAFKLLFGLGASYTLIKSNKHRSFKTLTAIMAAVVLWNIGMGIYKIYHLGL